MSNFAPIERLHAYFREQAAYCGLFGSPFTAALIGAFDADLGAGGPVAALIGAWPGDPRADAPALRLAGALHYAALSARDEELAALYPRDGRAWDMDAIWPAARAFLARERDWVAAFITSAPQTNEVRRAIALLAGFLHFAKDWRGPIDTLELGASAGLNLIWDRYAYRTQSWRWGGESAATIDTEWNGAPPPADAPLAVRARAACDLNPLDLADAAERMRLKSYLWPDQPERIARFEGAAALVLASGFKVERADAAEWLTRKLAARAGEGATVVYHSVFLQYPPPASRAAIAAAMMEAGARATADAPLAWLRLEPEALLDGVKGSPRMLLDLTTWPGGARRTLAATDGHVRAVYVLEG